MSIKASIQVSNILVVILHPILLTKDDECSSSKLSLLVTIEPSENPLPSLPTVRSPLLNVKPPTRDIVKSLATDKTRSQNAEAIPLYERTGCVRRRI